MNGNDLREVKKEKLIEHFGKQGSWFYDVVRGIDHRSVSANRERKSLGAEVTFSRDLKDKEILFQKLEKIVEEVSIRREKEEVVWKTLTLKIKFYDFHQITRSYSNDNYMKDEKDISSLASSLLKSVLNTKESNVKKIRLLGVSLSGLSSENQKSIQLSFLNESLFTECKHKL